MENSKNQISDKCDEFLNEASKLISESKYFDAILLCNKSLCCAKPKSKFAALAFAKRSSIYFKLKEYQTCLDDIKFARDIGCEDNEIFDENKCEEICKSELAKEKSSDDPWDFFKLSYKANEKIPFIVDCLKPEENTKYGRCVMTTRSLNPGDIVAIEEPFMKMLNSSARFKRCANCLKSNKMCLLPCENGKCTSSEFLILFNDLGMISVFAAMFCSTSCQKNAWRTFHKFECNCLDESLKSDNEYDMIVLKIVYESLDICGSIENLQSLISDIKPNSTIFNFDLSSKAKDIRRSLLKSMLSLTTAPTSNEDFAMAHWMIDSQPQLTRACKSSAQKDFLKKFVLKIMGILDRNSYLIFGSSLRKTFEKEEIGSGVFAFASLLNHSCSPNVNRIFVDNKKVFVVNKPIPAGAQLFVGYQ